MKYVPVATAPNQVVAEMWRDLLVADGIPATVSAKDVVSFLGISSAPCRVLVAEDQIERARELLAAQDIPVL